MKITKSIITCAVAAVALSMNTYAEKPEKKAKKGKGSSELRAAMKQKMLARFDADKDGQLSEEEKTTAKETLVAERKEIKAAVLKQFDADQDGKLSETEREGVREWVQKNYPDAIMRSGKAGKRKPGNRSGGNPSEV